jgi:hypothetical protein
VRLAQTVAVLLLVVSPTLAQPNGKAGWDERERKVVEALGKGKWEDARKRTRKLLEDVQSNSWEMPGVNRRLARLGRYLSAAEINLGEDREAVWHWLSAWNLAVPDDLETIAAWGRADVLLEYRLRTLGDMPPGFSPLSDLELLQIEPAEVHPTERPVLENDTARRAGPVTDLQVELLIDRNGVLYHPVINPTGVPAVGVWVTLDWMLAFPPATPATRDGIAVDVLQTVTVTFSQDKKPGFVFQ